MRTPPGDAGGFRDVWASHFTGIPVNANMVSIIITAVQSAVVAIENEVGTTAGRNYVRKDGAVTIIGLMTSKDRPGVRRGRLPRLSVRIRPPHGHPITNKR